MGMFSNLMSKIFSHGNQTSSSGTVSSAPAGTGGAMPAGTSGGSSGTTAPSATGAGSAGGTMPAATAAGAGAAPGTTPQANVDVTAILDGLAAKNAEKLDWRHSIVDLMKLVGMDSSLTARKELAKDLHYSGDMNDSAAMNVWLSKEVLRKLAENGGKVPADLLH